MLRSKLKNWLTWQPQPAEFLALMRPVKPWPVQLERYSRGIDNARVDVHLSETFRSRASTLARIMVRYEVATHYWGESESQPQPSDLDGFRDAYRGLVDGAMKQREQMPPADWVRLVQLSVLKYMLMMVPEEIRRLRAHLEKERDDENALHSGRRLEYHDRIVVLAREESAVAYRVYQRLFRLVDKLETMQLRKLRKSIIGVSWPVPREALFNALLQLPNLLAESEVMHHYPMFFVEETGKEALNGLNRCVTEIFSDYLPTWAVPGKGGSSEDSEASGLRFMDRLDQGGLRGFLETEIILSQLLSEEEYRRPLYSWLDEPENLIQLLRDPGDGESADRAPEAERQAKHWRQFRGAIHAELIQRVERLNIIPQVVASYWTPRIHKELGGKISPQLIYEYLTGRQDRRKLLRRLSAGQAEVDPALVSKTLDFAAGEIKQLSRESRGEYARRLLLDFLRLRRDLKLAYKTFEAMDQIRLLEDGDDLTLSRANNLIYEFRLSDEQSGERRIRSHSIMKADVRGSTRITSELRAKKLNPATHFSQNFFNPINEFLADFGANKVFVEGDAVILSFMEESGGTERNLCVAHACGLSARVLDVVARQNAVNRRHGLPELELGVGIAFCNEEPTFLYDEDRQITISPAINLADRLSSCSKALRNPAFERALGPFRVEVMLPAAGSDALAGSKMDVLRYNVNGIELDAEGFAKLKTELSMPRMDLRVAGRVQRFYVGRYPDRNGRMQWLVVREAPLMVWDGGQIQEGPPSTRRFYEVVVDPSLLTLIRSKLRSAAEARGGG